MEPLAIPPPHSHTSIIMVDAKAAFVTKEDVSPMPPAPVPVRNRPVQPRLAVTPGQDSTSVRAPAEQTVTAQQPGNGAAIYRPVMASYCVPGRRGRCSEGLCAVMTKDRPSLAWCGDLGSTGPGRVCNTSCCAETVQKSIYGREVNVEDRCHPLRSLPGLKTAQRSLSVLWSKSWHRSAADVWSDGNNFDLDFIGPQSELSDSAVSFTRTARATRPHIVMTR